jgi:hypothetical protein
MFLKILAFVTPYLAEFLLIFSIWASWNEFSPGTFASTAAFFDVHLKSVIAFFLCLVFAKIFIVNLLRDSLGYRSVGAKSRTQR